MKKSLIFTLLASLPLVTSIAWAADVHHGKDHKATTTMPMTEKDKQMDTEKQMKMQENMLRMHEQMHKIMDAKTPQDREMLMKEHQKMMHDSMHMMKGMMGGSGKMDKMDGSGKMDKMDGSGKMDGGMKPKY